MTTQSTARRKLSFSNPDEIAAEVTRLRKSATPTKNWNLNQICHHLNVGLSRAMTPPAPGQPAPPPPEVTPAIREKLAAILATGIIQNIEAPAIALPPPDAPDATVDQFLATLTQFKSHPGPFAPHRIFGQLDRDTYVRLQLIHCAHHLSHLNPTT